MLFDEINLQFDTIARQTSSSINFHFYLRKKDESQYDVYRKNETMISSCNISIPNNSPIEKRTRNEKS